MKQSNLWDKANQKKQALAPRPKFGAGKFNDSRVGNRRPGQRGK